MNQKKTCVFCDKSIENLKEANLFFAEYSHKSCDEKYFKKQEKRVKYFYKQQDNDLLIFNKIKEVEEQGGLISIKEVKKLLEGDLKRNI